MQSKELPSSRRRAPAGRNPLAGRNPFIKSASAALTNPMTGVDPSKLHFAYRISGNAPFRPNKIFDDGHFTWIRIPQGAWVMPALFIVRKGAYPGAKRYVLTNYGTKGDWIIVQRTFRTAVLRAGGETVTLHRLGTGG